MLSANTDFSHPSPAVSVLSRPSKLDKHTVAHPTEAAIRAELIILSAQSSVA